MAGQTNLNKLLKSMSAQLRDGVFVFSTLPDHQSLPQTPYIMRFEEAEGITLILRQDDAMRAGIAHEFPCRMITLNVHSSLDAVGFIAKIANVLAAEGMGVNPVAGFYHDHLFVPVGREQDAMIALERLSNQGD